jgi:hypothetical protein
MLRRHIGYFKCSGAARARIGVVDDDRRNVIPALDQPA